MAEESAQFFRVTQTQRVIDKLREWGDLARQRGTLASFLSDLRFIHDTLTRDPLGWGDPQRRLPHLDLLMCRGIHGAFAVFYGVNQEKRLVIINEIRLLDRGTIYPPLIQRAGMVRPESLQVRPRAP